MRLVFKERADTFYVPDSEGPSFTERNFLKHKGSGVHENPKNQPEDCASGVRIRRSEKNRPEIQN